MFYLTPILLRDKLKYSQKAFVDQAYASGKTANPASASSLERRSNDPL